MKNYKEINTKFITNYVTVTELANLTHKSRPTIYKYLESYCKGMYNNIPYTIVSVFMMVENRVAKQKIVTYCNKRFETKTNNDIQKIIKLLNDNKSKLNINRIKQFIKKEIKEAGK